MAEGTLKRSYNMRLEALMFLKERKEKGHTSTQTIHQALSAWRTILKIQAEGGSLCYENNKGQIEGLRFIE